MKYSILNCWTDYNRGDLGIMISTINEIREQDPEAKIIGVSCFSKHDSSFYHCHDILRNYVDNLYPAIFGLLLVKIGKYNSKSKFAKSFLAVFETIRMVLSIILPKSASEIMLYKFERETLFAIKGCDISIAKGGSVFTNNGTFRSKFSLFRMCAFYFLLNKYGYPYYILGQSFGPVHGKIPTWLVNKVIKNSEKVFLRETICKEKYNNIKFPENKTGFSNDTAFVLEQKKINVGSINENNFNIGITVRPAGEKNQQYITSLKDTIMYLVDKYDAVIHIFRQVSGEDEPDDMMAKKLYESLSDYHKKNVIIHVDNYTPQELKYLYGLMKLFIGTRLHSTIFALGAGTPSIALVYHGTKAQGIFKNLQLSEFVVTDVNSQNIIKKCDYILENQSEIKKKVNKNVKVAMQETKKAVDEIILRTKQRNNV